MSSYIPRPLLDQVRNAPDPDPTYRMSMLPFGTYPNADGAGEHLGLAMPGMIEEPVNALMRLLGTPDQPGTFTQGPDAGVAWDNPVRSQYPAQEDMRTLLESFTGGNASKAALGSVESAAAHALPDVASSGMRPGLTITRNGAPGASAAWHDIALDGGNIGKAYVREYPNTIQNSNFSIDPEFQRQGIGTEVQRELATMYGKPTVPDFTLSEAAYQRWLKNDPKAVADYRPWFDGASQYSPGPMSDAYFAAQGGPPVPGTRAAAGELFSDTGKPSLWGSIINSFTGGNATRGAGAVERGAVEAIPYDIRPPNRSALQDFMDRELAPGEATHYTNPRSPNFFASRFNGGGRMYEAEGNVGDNGIANVIWMGGDLGNAGINSLKRSDFKTWRDSFLQQHPDVSSFSGLRVSGAKAANRMSNKTQTIPAALLSDTGMPSLFPSSLQGQDQTYPNSLFNY